MRGVSVAVEKRNNKCVLPPMHDTEQANNYQQVIEQVLFDLFFEYQSRNQVQIIDVENDERTEEHLAEMQQMVYPIIFNRLITCSPHGVTENDSPTEEMD